MTVRVGINGFGRIGRNFFRAAKQQGADIDFVAVNDLGSIEHDGAPAQVRLGARHRCPTRSPRRAGASRSASDSLRVLSERNPQELPWGDLGVDVVIESTGFFNSRDTAGPHLDGGAPLVIVSAPCSEADATFVYGVNHEGLPDQQAQGDLQRELHHQLLRAAREGARRRVRHRPGADDDRARLHRRPVARRRPAQGSSPGASGRDQHHPDLHRRRPRHVARDGVDEGQARRHRASRAGAHRVAHRLHCQPQERGDASTRSTPRSPRQPTAS